MKKIKVIISIIIMLICVLIVETPKYANSDVKHALQIDTNLDNATFDKKGIHISGWKLATEANTKLKVSIDEKEVDEKCITYSYKYDLISIIGGYGTYKENPLPNYDINIPTQNIADGKHKLKIEFVLEDGTVLEKFERVITVEKVKHALQVDTNLDNATFDKKGIHISGWKLATETNNKLKVSIDEKEIDEKCITYSYKYDLISIIGGYGTYKENPLPNYDINIPTQNLANGRHKLKIELVLEDGTVLEKFERAITIDKSVKSALQIDTNLDNAIFDKKGIHISGWKLATEANNKLKVSIDEKEVDEGCITYSYKYDLISIIGGYGTYKENPLPNYDINIPTQNITDGKHKLKIEFVLEDGTILERFERVITVEKVKHALQVDTNLDNATFDKKGIHISGWKLATEANNKLKVSIDEKEIDEKYITYLYKYDLISIIGGYGTYKENPLPNYDINIPTQNITDGKHKLKIEFVLEDGTLLEKFERVITIDKSIKSVLQIDTNLNEIVFNEKKGIHISGWKLATEPNTKLVVSINEQEIDEKCTTYSYKYDLISIVGGYGTYKENPTPNFDINIPTKELSKQDCKIRIQFVTSDGMTVLKSVEFVAKYGGKYKGIDVSSFNGVIDWKQVANSGIDFAMIRIGYRGYRNPVLVRDTQALYNIKEAKASGLKIGVYFVTQAVNIEEAQEEALWVVSQLHQNGIYIDYPVVIDTEDSGARKSGNLPGRADLLDVDTRTIVCRAFADIIKYYGYTPAIYANNSWFKNKLKFSELDCYDIWLAHYTNDENKLSNFSGKYEIWQYTELGKIPGISKNVDLNICYKKY